MQTVCLVSICLFFFVAHGVRMATLSSPQQLRRLLLVTSSRMPSHMQGAPLSYARSSPTSSERMKAELGLATALLRRGAPMKTISHPCFGNRRTIKSNLVMQLTLKEDPDDSKQSAYEQELEVEINRASAWIVDGGGRRYPDAPITNRSLADFSAGAGSAKLVKRIERAAKKLEGAPLPFELNSTDADDVASGTWLLRYSNAPEITRLNKLPLGLGVEKIYQRVALANGIVENRALVRHKWRLLRQVIRVVARAEPADLEDLNRAGVQNVGNRLNVRFMKVVISLRRVLFLPTPFLRIVARPNGPNEKEGRTPTLDLTYVSKRYRVSRGGDGSLFVLERRPDSDVSEALENLDQVVSAARGFDGVTGKISKVTRAQ